MKRMQPKKRFKFIVLAVLVCIGLLGAVAGYLVLSHQPPAVVNDETEIANLSDEYAGATDEAAAVLSANVKTFTEEDASDINAAINRVEVTNQGIYMDFARGTELEKLGSGDIFMLEGSEATPLGETFIGKVVTVSSQGSDMTYLVESPDVDEVFDVLRFDYEQVMTTDNISDIETLPGVTATVVDSVADYFTESDAKVVPLAGLSVDKGLLLEYELDLLETFGLDKGKSTDFQEKYDVTQAGGVSVYTSDTGICYHRENCACVGRSKYKVTLWEAIQEGFEPCYLCNPPLMTAGGISNFSPSLTLNGRIGLENITFGIDYDWDILNGKGLENLSVTANGNFVTETELKANLQYEISGRTTQISLPMDCIKLTGLKEKMFPIAFIGYNGAVTPVVSGNESIRALTGAVPLTVGVMIYADISGNISVNASAYFDYNQSFAYCNHVVRDGEWILEQTAEMQPACEIGLETELSGDVDAHLGCSVLLYVFNLNVMDLAVAKVGTEAEGNIKLEYSQNTQGETENELTSSYYMRLYLKIMQLHIKLKAKPACWNPLDFNVNLNYTYTYLDKTIAEWGKKNPTRYCPGVMSYNVIAARDENAVYYKDTDGMLIREEGQYRSTIYEKDFFAICGIDESYIYLLVPNDDKIYDIYRVALDGSSSKKIIEDVVRCLTTDETYIYYVSDFDATAICRLNREYLQEETIANFKDDVVFMAAQGDYFYVATKENDFFASFFGGREDCYLIDNMGKIVEEYGSKLEVGEYYQAEYDDYYSAARITADGYLRDTASDVYWMSADKVSTVQTEHISGWNYNKAGIFTTLNNENTSETPYKIVLYQAVTGARLDVTEVHSAQAFFTLCQSGGGEWYFFDQTEEELILYVMTEDFSEKEVIKRFPLWEIPYNLTDCSMKIMDNRIYFYTMPDDTTAKVLYRYDII